MDSVPQREHRYPPHLELHRTHPGPGTFQHADDLRRALRQSELRAQAIWEHAIDAMVLSDAQGRVLDANPAFLELYGYSPEMIVGQDFMTVYAPELREWARDHYHGLFADQLPPTTYETLITRADGGTRVVHVRLSFLTEDGRRVAMLSIIRDITASHQIEAQARLQLAALEAAANAIMITDTEGRIAWVNPAFCALSGYRAEEAIGQHTRIQHSGAQTESFYRELWATIQAGQTWRGELINQRKDGSLYLEEQTITPVRDADGVIRHYVAIKQDASERAQRARELEAVMLMSAVLRSASTRAEMIPLILDQLVDLLRADSASIVMIHPNGEDLRIELGRGALAPMTGERVPAGQGIVGHVVATGQPYVANDLVNDPRFLHLSLPQPIVTAAAAPLSAQGLVFGAIMLGRAQHAYAPTFTESDLRMLTAIANMAGSAIYRAQLHEQTQERLRQLHALHEVNLAISSSMDLSVTLNILLDHVIAQLHVDAADVLLLHRSTSALVYTAGRGFQTPPRSDRGLTLDDPYVGLAVVERQSVTVTDLRAVSDFPRSAQLIAAGFVAYSAMPLIAKGEARGVLEVFWRDRQPIEPDWYALFHALAAQAAIAIDNTNLLDSLRRTNLELSRAYDATIEGWSRALDLRDKETEGHSHRVTEMTLRLAQAMGVDDDDMVHIWRGALLHDIGKMGIPDAILLKPGPLTEAEWQVMRRHPTYAYEMLLPIRHLRPALEIPYGHHERWDGSGYPQGLRGAQIPLAARIFAVADVWDALHSDRPYRRGWPEEQVIAYIDDHAGTLFDPEVVAAFLRLIRARLSNVDEQVVQR